MSVAWADEHGADGSEWASNKRETLSPVSRWWFVWMAFMFFSVVPALVYGWGYRGWGPPYPSYVQRRYGRRAGIAVANPRHYAAWGLGGDFVWLSLFVGTLWAGSALWWGW